MKVPVARSQPQTAGAFRLLAKEGDYGTRCGVRSTIAMIVHEEATAGRRPVLQQRYHFAGRYPRLQPMRDPEGDTEPRTAARAAAPRSFENVISVLS